MWLSARAIVLDGDQVLVIHRVKAGREYATLPGGGVEPEETDLTAAERELAEETSLVARALRVVGADDDGNVFVLMGPAVGVLRLGGAEALAHRPANSYRPAWVALADLDRITLLPAAARVLARGLAGDRPA